MAKKDNSAEKMVQPRDGFDNTGTQGYDSLSDDAFTGSSEEQDPGQTQPADADSHTGSSSEDFKWVGEDGQE